MIELATIIFCILVLRLIWPRIKARSYAEESE